MTRTARLIALLALSTVALLAAGCGQKANQIRTIGDTEGLYVDVGPLTYQVQISRYLNPADVEDRAYLQGLSAADRKLAGDQVWFGVFMRVQNYTDQTHTPASDMSIRDTQKNVYRPVSFAASQNPFVYQPRPLVGSGVLPDPESAPANGPIGGALILFKLNVDSIQNRPLELEISQGQGARAFIDLDV
jgi:hypothetical protein